MADRDKASLVCFELARIIGYSLHASFSLCKAGAKALDAKLQQIS